MKIGILLGTFDPVHINHVELIAEVLNLNLVDRVLVCPTVQNPWKERQPAPFDVRCEMLDAALEPLQEMFPGRVLVNDFEKTLRPPVYSYMLLGLIKKVYPNDDLYIICGEDIIPAIKDWKNFSEGIQPFFKYIMFTRGIEMDGGNETIASDSFINEEINMEGIKVTKRSNDISSTMIREKIANGKCPYPLINKGVFDIIKREGLYGFRN
jgi:nicotinate (nicotinamide) nucleotide adenylyltransferase